MCTNHAGQQHKGLTATGESLWQFDHPGQHPWHLEDGDLVLATECVLAAQMHDEIERFVGHLWQGMGRIDAHGQQQGFDLAIEIRPHPTALLGVALAVRKKAYSLPLECGQQHMVVKTVLFLHHGTGCINNARQRTRQMLARISSNSRFDVRSRPNLKKFVQIG